MSEQNESNTGFRIYSDPWSGFYWRDERLLVEVATEAEVLPAVRQILRVPADEKLAFHPEFREGKKAKGWFRLSSSRTDSGGNDIQVQVHCLSGEIPESLRPL